jgi:hypothetical protein
MKVATRIVQGLAVCLLLIFAAGCDEQWSQSEKDNAQHFIESLRLVNEAHDLGNLSVSAGHMSMADFEKIVTLYQKALDEAKLVTDPVLAKANSELPKAYRMYFQKGVELCISAWAKQRPSEDIHGDALLDEWGDWLEQKHGSIRIPP